MNFLFALLATFGFGEPANSCQTRPDGTVYCVPFQPEPPLCTRNGKPKHCPKA